ncbi:glycosyltransferase family 25 protein [Treponema sp. OMZ 840]|uniref:glycosyltransferase family 25 protein n=1 Tax=Treponema sp. OMZ 840 TaxID=244313 RepID=UPI003D8E74BF
MNTLKIPVFVISLKSASERRSFIQNQLKKLNFDFEFFDAFIGKDYASDPAYYNEKKALKAEGRKLRAGEVGCALSHNAVYRLIAEKKLPYALILEDDAIISEDLPQVIDKLLPYLDGRRIIQLERCDLYKKSSIQPLVKGYSIVEPRFIKAGTIAQAAGYLISFEAAMAIKDINFPVYFPADSWGYYKKYVHFSAVIPSQTCIRQSGGFFSSTEDIKTVRSFSDTNVWTFILHVFFTYNFFGRIIYRFFHPLYKRVFRWKK